MKGGELIREARRRSGLSQQALAERLGTSQSVITRWETGERSPTFEAVVRAVRACGLEITVGIAAPDPDHEMFLRANRKLSSAERVEQMTDQTKGLRELVARVRRS
ncbi:MAG: helix-turn-helix domain-containing protein [Actinomycetota bacterium]